MSRLALKISTLVLASLAFLVFLGQFFNLWDGKQAPLAMPRVMLLYLLNVYLGILLRADNVDTL